MAPDNGLNKVFVMINERALPMIGRPPATAESMRGHLETAGFVDVDVVAVKHPFGPWAKDKRLKHVGAMVLLNMETAIEAYVMYAATRLLKVPVAEAAEMCREALKAVRNKHTHMYQFLYVAFSAGRDVLTDVVISRWAGSRSRGSLVMKMGWKLSRWDSYISMVVFDAFIRMSRCRG